MKNESLILQVAKLGIFVFKKSYPGPSLIQFRAKGNKSKSGLKRVFQVISRHLFQEICVKSKNIFSSRLSFKKNGVNYVDLVS